MPVRGAPGDAVDPVPAGGAGRGVQVVAGRQHAVGGDVEGGGPGRGGDQGRALALAVGERGREGAAPGRHGGRPVEREHVAAEEVLARGGEADLDVLGAGVRGPRHHLGDLGQVEARRGRGRQQPQAEHCQRRCNRPPSHWLLIRAGAGNGLAAVRRPRSAARRVRSGRCRRCRGRGRGSRIRRDPAWRRARRASARPRPASGRSSR